MFVRSVVLLLLWCTDITRGQPAQVDLYKDRPLLRVMVSNTARLLCCYQVKDYRVTPEWEVSVNVHNGTKRVTKTSRVTIDNQRVTQEKGNVSKEGHPCYMLKVREVNLDDMGLYRCALTLNSTRVNWNSQIHTHGTFLQVYKPMHKFLDISESAKNKIILMEAILLLLCVLVPGIPLLCKKRKLNQMEKKNKGEEENIYEGLNLEDFNSTYHQIQRSEVRSPYQDVDTLAEDIQLEKP